MNTYINFNSFITFIFALASANIIYLTIKEKETLSFAIKNLYRNLRRTLLTMAAIITAAVSLIAVETYIENKYWGLRESTIRSELGHIQIQVPEFETKGKSDPTQYIINDYVEIIRLLQEDEILKPLIKKTSTELRFSGLVMGKGNSSVNFLGRGVEPNKEVFLSSFDFYTDGKELSTRRPNSIVIGEGLATFLGIGVGEYATLLSVTAAGSIDVADAQIRGIYQPLSSELSRVALKSPIDFAKNLMGVEGVNKILILLHHTEDTKTAASRIREILQSQNRNLTIYIWEDLAEFYSSVRSLYGNFFTFFRVIVSGVIFFLIMNTMTMSIFERFNEIGTLRAIGFTRRRIINLFTTEAYLLGMFSSFIGLGIGLTLCYFITSLDIMEPPPPGMNTEVPFSFYFHNNYTMLFQTVILLTIISWVSSFSPTFKSLKSKIVDCLRHH